jgi:uncharacterized protein
MEKETSLLSTIKAASVEARFARNAIRSSLLVTLFSEASMIGKNAGGRESTDAETIQIVKKFLNGNELALQAKPGDETLLVEKAILEEFLPKQMSDDELKAAIAAFIATMPPPLSPKSMGLVMKELNTKYTGLFDGGKASAFTKAALTA